MGIPCARKWPYWKTRQATPIEKLAQDSFSYINKIAGSLPEYLIVQYKRMAAGTPFTWRDLLVRSYISGIRY